MAVQRLRERVATRLPPRPSDTEAATLAEAIAQLGEGSVLGVIFFGSRKTKASPDQFSAYDFFVITRDYVGFYRRLREAGAIQRHPWLMAALNRLMPPNGISLFGEGWPLPHAKCLVYSIEDFLRETSERRRDHFAVARLYQATEILHAGSDASRVALMGAVDRARACTYRWVRPWLPEQFDVATYTRTLLRVSLGSEIRPESPRRATDLWEAQQAHWRDVYGALLAELAEAGQLVPGRSDRYRLAQPVRRGERWLTRCYFAWSRIRATSRWAKHVITFSGWMEYLRRKAERHSGQAILLTRYERRLPLICLWPRVLRFVRQKERRSEAERPSGPAA